MTNSYIEQTGTANPFNGINIGIYSAPTFADLDADGDLDALIGEYDGILNYYKNTGSSSNPVYSLQTGTANPFNGISVGNYSTPTLADLDADGDLDALIGEYDGILNYYKNTGSSSNPVYTEQTGTANPFNGINVGSYSTPTLADLDGDGDLDALIGEYDGNLNYYKNTGSSSNPVYTPQTGTANPFNGISVGYFSNPTLADLDGDGDLDALIGKSDGTLKYYKNTGSSSNPLYSEQTGTANPFNGIDVEYNSAPTLADLDGDGDLDALIIGASDGTLYYFQSTAPTPPGVTITQTGGSTQVTEGGATDTYTVVLNSAPTGDVTITLNSGTQLSTNVPTLTFTAGNWNVAQTVTVTAVNDTVGEGPHQGVITSTVSSTDSNYNGLSVASVVAQITDNDLPTTPRLYTPQTGTANPFNGISVGFYSTPTLADLDADGDLDALIGEKDGTLNYYQNTGSSSNPVYTEQTGTANPFNGIDVGSYSKPTFADLDADGDLDALIGERYGTLKYYQNTGSSSNPVYIPQTGTANPFNGIDVGNYSTPTLADLDGDGDLDALIGEGNGILNYYQNTGSSTNPVYTEQTGTANPFNGISVGFLSTPTLADLDGDGDLDAVIGEYYGTLKYYQNAGSSSNPLYSEQTGTANPFNGIDIEGSSAPTFADLDADGDLDALIGEQDGTLNYFESVVNTAPTIASGATATFAENGTGTAYQVIATDPESNPITYGLNQTGDWNLFNINSATGLVTFKTAPNYESPTDAGANNVYDITVTASDASLTTSKAVAITVTDVNPENFVTTLNQDQFALGTGDDSLTSTLANLQQNDNINALGGTDTFILTGGTAVVF
jgi:uncharacterized protein (DUF2141 family)